MAVDVVNIRVNLRRAARIAAALDLYAANCELIDDDVEASYARHDRDVIRQYLAETYGDER